MTDVSDVLAAHHTRDLAQRENRTKDEFLATFAHELRTPLGAIGAAAQLLEATRAAAGAGSSRPYNVIVRQVDHVARLINDLLDVERVVFEKVRLNRQPVDLGDAIRQVVAALSVTAPVDRHITVSTEPLWVDWDAVRLQQVLTGYMQAHDSQSAMLTMLRSRAREHWKVVASPATTNMRMEVTAVSFQLQDEQHVSFKMLARASIDWTDSDGNARRWLYLPEYTSSQLDAKTWTTDQSLIDEHLQRAYSKIADDIVAALRKEPESSKALLQKLPR